MPFVELPPVRLHFQQKLDAADAIGDIVLIHGFTSNLSVWMFGGIMEGLGDDYRVTAFDMRGHGASSIVPSGYTSDIMAGDLLRLMDHLHIERTHLLGHSLGGVVAVHAATIAPDRVSAIILSDTYFPGLRDLEPNMGQAGVWQNLRDTLLSVGIELGPTVDFPRLFSVVQGMDADQQTSLRQQLGPVGERWLSGLTNLVNTSAGSEVFETAGLDADSIASIGVPVLALYDEHSPFAATNEFLATNLKHCSQGVVDGANHLAPLENPQAIICESKQFLAAL